MAGDVVWWPAGPGASRGSVAALTVLYNTRELTAFLLWSLRTIVSWPELEIVVVDNGSRDGSAQLLAEAERDGVCTLLANHGNRHHGPGLNQGISYLASRTGPRPEWIWILDSDVVAARADALSAAAAAAREHSAALVGEPQHDQWHLDGRFGMYSLLMDPAVAWQEQAGPFAAAATRRSACSSRPRDWASRWRPSRSPPQATSSTADAAASPRSTPPGTAPIPSTSGPRTTTPRTSPEFPARTSDTTPCCRNSVKRQARSPEQPWPQPATAHQATSNTHQPRAQRPRSPHRPVVTDRLARCDT